MSCSGHSLEDLRIPLFNVNMLGHTARLFVCQCADLCTGHTIRDSTICHLIYYCHCVITCLTLQVIFK